MKKQALLNTYINNLTMQEAVRELMDRLRGRKVSYVVPVNVDVLVKMETDSYLKEIARRADLTLADGKPLLWIAGLFGKPLKQKISGSDLAPALLKEAAKLGYSVYILGGMGDAPAKAAAMVRESWKGIRIAGFFAPPFGFERNEDALKRINERIRAAEPDILLACFGCPKQEKWVYENYRKTSAVVTICAGATVDFLAGTARRAPGWVSRMGFEWFYRFLQEPRRLFRRYFVDDLTIIPMIWKYGPRQITGKRRGGGIWQGR